MRHLILSAVLGSLTALLGQVPGIQVVTPLQYGSLLVSEQGGSITLTDGGRLVPYSGSIKAGSKVLPREAQFNITGPPRAPYTLTLDPLTPTLVDGKGNALRIAAFELGTQTFTGTFDANGMATLHVGARLDVPADTPPGLYTNTQTLLKLATVQDGKPVKIQQAFTMSTVLEAVLQLRSTQELAFGNLLPGDRVGKYRVSPQGNAGPVEGSGIRQMHGKPTAAEFILTGPPSVPYSIVLPSSTLLTGPGNPLEVVDFEASTPLFGTLQQGGAIFKVGASIIVPPDQQNGLYRGTFTVVVCYQ